MAIQENSVEPRAFAVLPDHGTFKPKEVVEQLDKYIVGQPDAKKAVAIALRNRWRRQKLSPDMRDEVMPKNILMIGPTGCGKTEIARRIAKLSQAPFIKVEATKYTEVGYHGSDVDQMIKDLVEISLTMTKKKLKEDLKERALAIVHEKLLIALTSTGLDDRSKEALRLQLLSGDLDGQPVDVTLRIPSQSQPGAVVENGQNMGAQMIDMMRQMGGSGKSGRKKGELKQLTVAEARPQMVEEELEDMMQDHDVVKLAIAAVEESGIVFIDEIDKIVNSGDYRGSDASSEGVQRDLLPLIEGTTVTTKHGKVETDHILFIASGAFHSAKPSDLLAELQGRLPIRVALKGLTEADLYKILTEPATSLIRQQVALMKSEGVDLVFTADAIRELARVAFTVNRTVENIGARRLHTIVERVMEEISFDAPDKSGEKIEVTEEYVKTRVSSMVLASDMRKYII